MIMQILLPLQESYELRLIYTYILYSEGETHQVFVSIFHSSKLSFKLNILFICFQIISICIVIIYNKNKMLIIINKFIFKT